MDTCSANVVRTGLVVVDSLLVDELMPVAFHGDTLEAQLDSVHILAVHMAALLEDNYSADSLVLKCMKRKCWEIFLAFL